MTATVVRLRDGNRTLPGGARLLKGVDLDVVRGESIAIIGRSGSGKSTLLAGLGLLAPFDGGTHYELGGVDVATISERKRARLRAQNVGFVLQNAGLVSHLSAIENVEMPLIHSRTMRLSRTRARASEMLDLLEVGHLSRRRSPQVSGGERQRIAIARALAIDPDLILADEPTGALDEVTGRRVLDEMLSRVAQAGAALIVVTHDPEVAARTDRTYRLDGGTLREEARAS
ncbi:MULTISPECIES: ABC transporter ATP-binding protein [unclassified Microbacterium]|uniref:ABC transporter ATP-binding protein n=1 Tax=unclassified Microbacterium TaxID=2609290 RepID=UPI000E72C601|nr:MULTISPECIES: ATP-binding cassette domain-containing protein [unclassified Microbacterium]MDF2563025.1 transporter ATP-binding protein [Microbacterium sp.]RKE64700.1 putative ABC transport system ATP-binding protein [Microbacterium sp. AG238]